MTLKQLFSFCLVITTLAGCIDDAPPVLDPQPDVAVDASLPDIGQMDSTVDLGSALDLGPARDAATAPLTPTTIETTLGSNETPAGEFTEVTCTVFDDNGDPMERIGTDVRVAPRDGWGFDDDTNRLFGHTPGAYGVQCVVPRLAIADPSPEPWTVIPGAIVSTRAESDPIGIVAGQQSKITCEAYDVMGNRVDASALEPVVVGMPAGTEIQNDNFTATRAGVYRVICPNGGARADAAVIEVRPGPPVRLIATVDPELPVYQTGAIIAVLTRAVDAYDNHVPDAQVSISATPDLPRFGPDRFQLNADGRYTLRAVLRGAMDGVIDEVNLPVIVDSGGPTIQCTTPSVNAMRLVGERVLILAEVSDPGAIVRVTIDGVEVAADAMGRFSREFVAQPGINIHTVQATDEFGNTSEIYCPFFAADQYLPEGQILDNGILLDLRQGAVDDGAPDDPIGSLTDVFRKVLDSPSLAETLNAAGQAANPILPNRCFQRVFGACIFRAEANFNGLSLDGDNDVSLTLIDGGLAIEATLRDVNAAVRISGTLSTTGRMGIQRLRLNGEFDIRVNPENGRPLVALRGETARVTVGRISTDFGGVAGWLLDLLFPLFEGTVRDELGAAMRGFIFEELDSLLSDALGGLDLSSFGAGFDVESPNGEAVRINLETSTSDMNATPRRLRIAVGTRAGGPQGHARPSAGVPIFGDLDAIEVDHDRPETLGAIIHMGMVNQLLHTLWRAGFFEIADAGDLAGDAGGGFEFSFNLLVPPAIRGQNNSDEALIYLGPAQALLSYPGIIDRPIGLLIAAVLRLPVGIVDGNLSFGAEGIEFEELNLLIEDVPITPEDRAAIEETFGGLVRNLVDSALGGALPSLPVPEIPLPADLSALWVPPEPDCRAPGGGCPGPGVCNGGSGRCDYPSCDDGCQDGTTCHPDGRCRPDCRLVDGCRQGLSCNAGTGVCGTTLGIRDPSLELDAARLYLNGTLRE